MERRNVLKTLAGGAIGWAAVDGLFGSLATPAFAGQVPFVRDPSAAGFDVRPEELFAVDDGQTARLQTTTYPQSVASGDPKPYGVVLWTRIDPTTVVGLLDELVGWQISRTADFAGADVVLAGVALVLSSRDNTVTLPIAHPALAPFSIYYYRFIYNGVASRTGRFKTMPRAGAAIEQLRIAYVVCQDYSNEYYTAYRLLAENEEVDVVVHLGDYIYEYLNDGVGGPGNGPVRVVPPFPSGAATPQGLRDYRHLLTATTPQPALRQQANQAWTEHGLADTPFHPDLGV